MAETKHSCNDRCGRCPHCTETEDLANRVDIWRTAEALLASRDWGKDDEGKPYYAVDAPDILMLATFLAG